jgi:hypothetical protein
MRNALAAGLLFIASSGTAIAADNGFYLGGAVGNANVEIDDFAGVTSDDFKGDDTGYKLIAGIRPLDWLAVEAAWVDFGDVEDRITFQSQDIPVSIEGDGISAFAVGFLPIGPVDLFAKGGLISWDSKISGDFDDDDGTDLAYGVGAQFRVWSLSLRAEYEIFDVDGVDDLNRLSVGVTFTFL